jgi:hypothetical protein
VTGEQVLLVFLTVDLHIAAGAALGLCDVILQVRTNPAAPPAPRLSRSAMRRRRALTRPPRQA